MTFSSVDRRTSVLRDRKNAKHISSLLHNSMQCRRNSLQLMFEKIRHFIPIFLLICVRAPLSTVYTAEVFNLRRIISTSRLNCKTESGSSGAVGTACGYRARRPVFNTLNNSNSINFIYIQVCFQANSYRTTFTNFIDFY